MVDLCFLDRPQGTAIRYHTAYRLRLRSRLLHRRLNADIDFTDIIILIFPMAKNALQVIRFNPAADKLGGHLNRN